MPGNFCSPLFPDLSVSPAIALFPRLDSVTYFPFPRFAFPFSLFPAIFCLFPLPPSSCPLFARRIEKNGRAAAFHCVWGPSSKSQRGPFSKAFENGRNGLSPQAPGPKVPLTGPRDLVVRSAPTTARKTRPWACRLSLLPFTPEP